ncbi:hypothetical protein GCM10009868_15560 [Terrabacter aerolatus]|uniref:Uncharacterized protein n=1 Tax=Terrabacter aerolatus TaxID=422442 RepID=A0A512D3W3_9MICO|nr:hypothetical protein TAE01_29520 [Terrabacter aerolatus]
MTRENPAPPAASAGGTGFLIGGAEGIRTPDLLIANRCGAVVVVVLVRCMRYLGALGGWAFWDAGDTGGTRLSPAGWRIDRYGLGWVVTRRKRYGDSATRVVDCAGRSRWAVVLRGTAPERRPLGPSASRCLSPRPMIVEPTIEKASTGRAPPHVEARGAMGCA